MFYLKIIDKALGNEMLTHREAVFLYKHAPLEVLMFAANEMKRIKKPGNTVTWIIDRNVNITNVCVSGCLFCNFCRGLQHSEAYITGIDEYENKIDELFQLGGQQLLLQGGLHPQLDLTFYVDLFKQLKSYKPELKLHALGPPEIIHIANMEGITYRQCLQELMRAGLDSLPGAGAEILSNRVRRIISKNKFTVEEWLKVMHEAHDLGMISSATMMFGHIETIEERVEHLIHIRNTQAARSKGSIGFISFIPWTFQSTDTVLIKKSPQIASITQADYIRLLAMSRIVLNNIDNIQPSWLTVGVPTAQLCLHAGANDFGSVMIEEHVVSSAGANYWLNIEQMQKAIRQAGFVPKLRNQKFEESEFTENRE